MCIRDRFNGNESKAIEYFCMQFGWVYDIEGLKAAKQISADRSRISHYGAKKNLGQVANIGKDVYKRQLKEIELQKRELEREKIKFRDERNAWQKQNYIDARVEQKLDLLEEQLLSQGKVNFKKHGDVNISSNNDILVILSDFHIGQTFSSPWGNYNSDIAKGRLSQLLSEIIAIRQLYNSENCFISLQGDMLSGNIHKTIQVTNRENVIQQIKIASELISSFCYERCV